MIIVALDYPTLAEAVAKAKEFSGKGIGFKVGLELLVAEGSRAVLEAINPYGKVFYDGKFADIPTTVGRAVKALGNFDVPMFNVYAATGSMSMKAAAENKGTSLALAVTVLTTMDEAQCEETFGSTDIAATVIDFATQAKHSGMDGVVCSPLELTAIRSNDGLKGFVTVVPGVRPTWAAANDQKRIMTPGEAIKAGANYLVIGRPITNPPAEIGSSLQALQLILEDVDRALAELARA